MIALQRAIYQKLNSVLTIPVFDVVPPGQSLPYVVIDGLNGRESDSVSSHRTKWNVLLTVWTGDSDGVRGKEEALGFMSQIYKALHRQDLILTEGRAVEVLVTNRRTEMDIDDRTCMGRLVISILIEE